MEQTLETVETLKINDNAGSLRVEILGRLAGSTVDELSRLWESILKEQAPRRFTVDVTNLSGYDHIGCALLRDMHRHGVHIAAASAASLVFLAEITAPVRPRPSLVPNKPVLKPAPGKSAQSSTLPSRPRLAAGE